MAQDKSNVPDDLQDLFYKAADYVRSNLTTLSNQQMLKFYGLYKQATKGSCNIPKPSWHEFTEKQKWEAWSLLEDLSSFEAMEKYINTLTSLDPKWEYNSLENSNGCIHHSCMQNTDEVIRECEKTIFDWVKEQNLVKVKKFSPNIKVTEINNLDENGLSLLHWAADRGNLDIVKYIIETLHANVNCRDSNGQTALHYAVSCGHDDIVKYLIESGGDISLKDNSGKTPHEVLNDV